MDRRMVLRRFGGGLLVGSTGCIGPSKAPPDIDPVLTINPKLHKTDAGWELTARVKNDYDWDVSIHNIILVAFSETGEEACRTHVGDLLKKEGPPDRTVTVTCSVFPAIVSATAEESPCDGAKIDIYYWVGSDEERKSPNDISLWETTHRRCNESLPPERVLEKVNATDEETDPS